MPRRCCCGLKRSAIFHGSAGDRGCGSRRGVAKTRRTTTNAAGRTSQHFARAGLRTPRHPRIGGPHVEAAAAIARPAGPRGLDLRRGHRDLRRASRPVARLDAGVDEPCHAAGRPPRHSRTPCRRGKRRRTPTRRYRAVLAAIQLRVAVPAQPEIPRCQGRKAARPLVSRSQPHPGRSLLAPVPRRNGGQARRTRLAGHRR